MAKVFFENPPTLRGTPEEQQKALREYLYTLSQKLNEAVLNIGFDQLEQNSKQTIQQLQDNAEKSESKQQGLKELIVKNAELTRTEDEEIRAQLTRNITALSTLLGEYRETLTQDIEMTAAGIRQTFNLLQETVNTANQTNETFRTGMQSYIYSGVLDSSVTPNITGIAIGQNVTNSDGTLNSENVMATFTAKRITFYNQNNVVGYYEGNKFHIGQGEVTDSMKMGHFLFKVFPDGSMGLMKEA